MRVLVFKFSISLYFTIIHHIYFNTPCGYLLILCCRIDFPKKNRQLLRLQFAIYCYIDCSLSPTHHSFNAVNDGLSFQLNGHCTVCHQSIHLRVAKQQPTGSALCVCSSRRRNVFVAANQLPTTTTKTIGLNSSVSSAAITPSSSARDRIAMSLAVNYHQQQHLLQHLHRTQFPKKSN